MAKKQTKKKEAIARAMSSELFDVLQECSACYQNKSPRHSRFCSNCGAELPRIEPDNATIIDGLYLMYINGKKAEAAWETKKNVVKLSV